MEEIKFPVIDHKGDNVYPEGNICPICKKEKVFTKNDRHIEISGGGLFVLNKKEEYKKSIPETEGFLSLVWYEKVKNKNGISLWDGSYMDIVERSANGIYSLSFCSTKCLREFINKCLDEFERRVEKRKELIRKALDKYEKQRKGKKWKI